MNAVTISLISIAAIFLFFFIAFIFISEIIFKFVLKRCDKKTPFNPKITNDHMVFITDDNWFENTVHETIELKSYDNINLKGFLFKNDTHKYLLTLHGYHGLYSENSYVGAHFFNKGFNVLMPCCRGHFVSGGKYFTMGIKERYDVKQWIEYIVSIDKHAEIAIYGLSMGAGTLLMTLGLSLPKNIKCAIEDCGYCSIYEQVKTSIKSFLPKGLQGLSLICFSFGCRMHGFSNKLNTSETLKDNKIPTLFIHGRLDNFVLFKNLEINYSNMKSPAYKEKHIFENAAHASSLGTEPNKYMQICDAFVEKFIE